MLTGQQLIRWAFRPAEHIVLQVPRALVASGLSGGLDFGILVALVQYAGWNPLLAATASYVFGGILQYLLCALWVFPAAPESVPLGVVVFTMISLVGLGITWAAMALFHNLAHVNYAAAKILALGIAFFWNFLGRKYWLFDRAPRTPALQPE